MIDFCLRDAIPVWHADCHAMTRLSSAQSRHQEFFSNAAIHLPLLLGSRHSISAINSSWLNGSRAANPVSWNRWHRYSIFVTDAHRQELLRFTRLEYLSFHALALDCQPTRRPI